MDIACLFGGAGLASLGLALAGHRVVSIELDPRKHALAVALSAAHNNAFECVLADVRDVDLSKYRARWASPPCSELSSQNHTNATTDPYGQDMMGWTLAELQNCDAVTWIENTRSTGRGERQNKWGTWYNAAQFTEHPIQNRNRLIGGTHFAPAVYRPHAWTYGPTVCPCITTKVDEPSQAHCYGPNPVQFYGRPLTPEDVAYHMGLPAIPPAWYDLATPGQLIDAMAKGVFVPMARAFGEVYAHIAAAA